jgi:3-methyladenine DNA glycosylase/8-oxoguanine DNA glycosylase
MVKRKIANMVVDAEASLRSRGHPRTRRKATTTTTAAACSTTRTKDTANTIKQETLSKQNPPPKPSHCAESSSKAEEDRLVNRILESAGIDPNQQSFRVETKAGWCLRQGLKHLVSVDNGAMAPLVEKHGAPSFYACLEQHKKQPCRHPDTNNKNNEATPQGNDPQNCFQSLCRIVAGQQLAGAAALAIWKRLLDTVGYKLTPQSVLDLVDVRYSSKEDVDARVTKKAKRGSSTTTPQPSLVVDDVSRLQKPAGLSQSKATSIVHLAHAFQEGYLSDAFLTKAKMNDNNNDDDGDTGLRDALLQIKGIGPWSCDMFLMFYLERPNVLPLGDLGVRKGIGRFFAMKPLTKTPSNGGMLCAKKDADRIHERLAPYNPYQSLLTYYMWKAADTKDFYNDDKNKATVTDGEKPNSSNKGKKDRAKLTPKNSKTAKEDTRKNDAKVSLVAL